MEVPLQYFCKGCYRFLMEAHLTPKAAIDQLIVLHEEAVTALKCCLNHYIATREPPVGADYARFCYPELRVSYEVRDIQPTLARAYAKFQGPGTYVTTITQPKYFASYLSSQLTYLVQDYGAIIDVNRSSQKIPYPYVLDHTGNHSATMPTAAELALHFPTPQLANVGDEIADGTYDLAPDGVQPLALFDAVRIDYSLQRLIHYTGTHWENIQPWILLTNYHRYVDQFIIWGLQQLQSDSPYEALYLPGGAMIDRKTDLSQAQAIIDATAWHRFQMPGYHLSRKDLKGGVSLFNIGVGPSNAKNLTDHLAVIRPNCWLMIGHCGGLRQSQRIGDYVLAHGYLRQDHILDSVLPPDIPIPALAEVQVALQAAAANITGEHDEALKKRLRTGTVLTNDDRNWELRWALERRRINLSRAIAVDMESGTLAAQGYRLRVPYGTLLCVSDKPLHGEIKLPGSANSFYDRAVGEHFMIGLAAIDHLRNNLSRLHSRKLRSFDEPPFR